MYRNIVLDKSSSKVAWLTMNRPENLNALGVEMSREIMDAMSDCAGDPAVRVLVLQGAGRAFSSGGNVREMKDSLDLDPAAYMAELTEAVYTLIDEVRKFPKPVLASIKGFAYGAAMNLVMACDLALASDDAVFCESFIKLGLIPGGHATVLLTEIAGPKKALELSLTGREIDAGEAMDIGIVNSVVPAQELDDCTAELAQSLAKAPPLAVIKTKELLRSARTKDPAEQSRIEREAQIEMAATSDYAEGIRAFFEKREPDFKGG